VISARIGIRPAIKAPPCQRQVLITPLSRGVTRKCLLRLGTNSKILININKPVHTIKWSKREPIAVREAHYQKVRNRIFGKHHPDRNISPKIARTHRRSQQRKAERRMICSAIRAAVEGDNRPFAQVKIEDLEVVGLLDSGASVSLLGEGCLETVERLGL